jgi:hypothetical protein
MNTNDLKYKQKIMENLEMVNMTWDEFIALTYCGRDVVDREAEYKTDPNAHTPNKYFSMHYPDMSINNLITFKCICDKPNLINHFFIHDNNDQIITLGSCCIARFLPKEARGKTCERCKIPHKNRLDNYCKGCRKKYDYYNRGMFNFGKYNGRCLKDIVTSDRSYIEWLVSKGKTEYQFFLDFIQ